MVRTELRKIIGRDVFCVAKSDDDTYWDISFPLERLPLSDLHRILEALDATDSICRLRICWMQKTHTPMISK